MVRRLGLLASRSCRRRALSGSPRCGRGSRGGRTPLFVDSFAAELAGELGFAMMARSEEATGREKLSIPVRVRWFDDAVMVATSGLLDQVVLLGAGMDTRPARGRWVAARCGHGPGCAGGELRAPAPPPKGAIVGATHLTVARRRGDAGLVGVGLTPSCGGDRGDARSTTRSGPAR
jgi:Leucine carboxyl methyltransferase